MGEDSRDSAKAPAEAHTTPYKAAAYVWWFRIFENFFFLFFFPLLSHSCGDLARLLCVCDVWWVHRAVVISGCNLVISIYIEGLIAAKKFFLLCISFFFLFPLQS